MIIRDPGRCMEGGGVRQGGGLSRELAALTQGFCEFFVIIFYRADMPLQSRKFLRKVPSRMFIWW
jgi:hypothetical protein